MRRTESPSPRRQRSGPRSRTSTSNKPSLPSRLRWPVFLPDDPADVYAEALRESRARRPVQVAPNEALRRADPFQWAYNDLLLNGDYADVEAMRAAMLIRLADMAELYKGDDPRKPFATALLDAILDHDIARERVLVAADRKWQAAERASKPPAGGRKRRSRRSKRSKRSRRA